MDNCSSLAISNDSDRSMAQSSEPKQNSLSKAINTPEPENATKVKSPSTYIHLLSGGSAGLVSALTLQPLDLLKTRLQQQQKENVGYRTTVTKEIKKLARIRDLWRGVIPSTLRTSVGAGLYFTILSRSRQHLALLKASSDYRSSTSVLPKLSHVENLASGFIARALVGFLTMPITVVKTRFESSVYSYNSMYESFQGIYSDGVIGPKKGSIKNFFKGTVATLARDCPYAGLYVLFYEGFKNDIFPTIVRPLFQDEAVFAGVSNSASAIAAASVATAITAPFDAIKTRLQLSTSPSGNASIGQITRQLMREQGGVRNLFSGLSLRLGRKALSAGISWCIYEELLKYL